ncbi:MAG: peptidoglycan-associated lipoprotein Pal [Alphaproteobacteria bacterium]
MLARNLTILTAVLLLGACASKTDQGDIQTGINDGVIVDDSLGVYDDAGPTPGTQADLVVNVGDRIFFETDSTDLTASARTTLENQAAWLAQYPSIGVAIEGHADERGTREYNLALGERRSNSVRNYLVALGVSPARISTISYGKERPAVPGSNDSAWSQNRRSVTKVQ